MGFAVVVGPVNRILNIQIVNFPSLAWPSFLNCNIVIHCGNLVSKYFTYS